MSGLTEQKKRKSFKEIVLTILQKLKAILKETLFFMRVFVLVFFVFLRYLSTRSARRTLNKPNRKALIDFTFLKNFYEKIYNQILKILDTQKPGEVKSSDLILLAMRNLSARRNRTYVTIGGMAIGFGSVILLLSLGYGFERLVISQVASLTEMKQVEVSSSQGSPLKFTADVIGSINEIEDVDSVIPIITSVSKVTYNNAVSDVIVYAVNSKYFEQTNIDPLSGNYFNDQTESIRSTTAVEEEKGVVAGASSVLIGPDSLKSEVSKVYYSIHPAVWKPVFSEPSSKSKILGYTKRDIQKKDAVEVWGERYADTVNSNNAIDLKGKEYSTWISDTFPLWKYEKCSSKDYDCIDNKYVVLRESGTQQSKEGYISQDDVTIERYSIITGSSLEIYKGKTIEEITFSFQKEKDTNMYFDYKNDSNVSILKASNQTEEIKGEILYGDYYDNSNGYYIQTANGLKYGYWVKSTLPLWTCDSTEEKCNTYSLVKTEKYSEQRNISIYLKASELLFSDLVDELVFSKVLGEETDSLNNLINFEDLVEEDDTIDWAQISSQIGTVDKINKEVKNIPSDAQKVAIVNTAMLDLLGLSVDDALGKTFGAKFIFDSKLFDKTNYVVESDETTIDIVGVISDAKSPAFYIPLGDILVDGINNVSNIKVILKDTEAVAGVRTSIESMGFQTASVVDTVDSISKLFDALRIALLVVGMIALGVASLGMFNTLTVSLLEKTREVGLLKTMGLKSSEVKTLFLAESVIMSVFGGLGGLFAGFAVGKGLSILISILSVTQGNGIIDLTYIPFALGFGLVSLSALVGIGTGWYPAERAKKISALNALRYE